jgi:hypothetical protein
MQNDRNALYSDSRSMGNTACVIARESGRPSNPRHPENSGFPAFAGDDDAEFFGVCRSISQGTALKERSFLFVVVDLPNKCRVRTFTLRAPAPASLLLPHRCDNPDTRMNDYPNLGISRTPSYGLGK